MRIFASLVMLLISVITINASSATAHAQTKPSENHTSKKHAKKVTVKKGDSLSKIGKRQHTSYKRIFYANKQIKDPNVIYAGEKLRIPAKDEKLHARPLGVVHTSTKTITTSHTAPYKAPQKVSYSTAGGGVWDKIASCESGGNWSINTGNGYYGGLQFTVSSWRAVGGSGLPSQASKSEQIARAKILQSRQGWGAWPACTAKLGIL